MTTIIDFNLKRMEGCDQALVTHNGNYYVVSYSYAPRLSEPETFIFKCDKNGTVTDWREVGGTKYATLDEVIADMDEHLYSSEHLAFLGQV